MKEYNETEALARMCAVLPAECRDEDSVCEVLDLIYDYYEENGELDLDCDSDDDTDVADMVAYIARYFKKNAPAVAFTDEQIAAMIAAEIEYEDSLI